MVLGRGRVLGIKFMLNRDRVSLRDDENVLERDGGDGCTTV